MSRHESVVSAVLNDFGDVGDTFRSSGRSRGITNLASKSNNVYNYVEKDENKQTVYSVHGANSTQKNHENDMNEAVEAAKKGVNDCNTTTLTHIESIKNAAILYVKHINDQCLAEKQALLAKHAAEITTLNAQWTNKMEAEKKKMQDKCNAEITKIKENCQKTIATTKQQSMMNRDSIEKEKIEWNTKLTNLEATNKQLQSQVEACLKKLKVLAQQQTTVFQKMRQE